MNGTQTRTLSGGARFATIAGLGAMAAAVAFVALVVFGGGGGRPTGGGAPIATPLPTAAPSETPSESPSESPTAAPTEVPGDGAPIRVELDTVDGHDVSVEIRDRTGRLVGAESGSPAEGASVDYDALEVENLDERTLRLTWTDYPINNELVLFVDDADGGLRLVLVRPDPTGVTDSIGLDREIVLTFATPVSAGDVRATVQEGLDTAG